MASKEGEMKSGENKAMAKHEIMEIRQKMENRRRQWRAAYAERKQRNRLAKSALDESSIISETESGSVMKWHGVNLALKWRGISRRMLCAMKAKQGNSISRHGVKRHRGGGAAAHIVMAAA